MLEWWVQWTVLCVGHPDPLSCRGQARMPGSHTLDDVLCSLGRTERHCDGHRVVVLLRCGELAELAYIVWFQIDGISLGIHPREEGPVCVVA